MIKYTYTTFLKLIIYRNQIISYLFFNNAGTCLQKICLKNHKAIIRSHGQKLDFFFHPKHERWITYPQIVFSSDAARPSFVVYMGAIKSKSLPNHPMLDEDEVFILDHEMNYPSSKE